MTWGDAGRRKEWLGGAFLLVVTLVNVASVVQVVPLLEKGYQDFTIFYGAAKMVRDGQGRGLYDLAAQYQMQHRFAPKVAIRQAALPYNHPPFEALIFVPFTFLTYLQAYLLWSFLNLVMLALSLRIVRKTFPEVGGLSLVFAMLAASGFLPVVNGFIQGQDSILLLFLVTLSLASLEERHDRRAGVALGMALFKFHLAIPLTLLLAVRRPRLLRGFVPAAVVLVVVSAAMVGSRGLVDYVQFLFRLEKGGAGGAIVTKGMPNLHGLIAELPGMSGGGGLTIALTVVCSIAAMGIALWQITRRHTSIRFEFVVASVTAVLVSYHTLTYDLGWLLIVLLLLFTGSKRMQGEMQADILLLVAVYVLLLSSAVWPRLGPSWFVPFVIWIFRKYGRGDAAESAA